MHLENNNADSAIFYARRAIGNASKWRCGYLTLASAFKLAGQPDSSKKFTRQSQAPDPSIPVELKKQPSVKPGSKLQVGIVAAGGTNNLNITLSNWDRTPVNYNDSLISISATGKAKVEIGIIGQVSLSNSLSWRPGVTL